MGRLAELMGESVPEGTLVLDEAPPVKKQETCPCCGQEVNRGKKKVVRSEVRPR